MFFKIVCMMVDRLHLTPTMRESLFLTSCQMVRDGTNEHRMKTPEFEGIIKTDFKPHRIGSFFGVRFLAEGDSNTGKGRVEYLIDTDELDEYLAESTEYSWVECNTRRAQKAHLN